MRETPSVCLRGLQRMMNEEMDVKEEYEKLSGTIKYHMKRYYDQDDPEISDA